MNTPNITTAQMVAVIGAVFALLAAFGLHVTGAERGAIVNLATVLAPVLVAADAVIRHGRSKIAAAALSSSSSRTVTGAAAITGASSAGQPAAPLGPPAGG